MGVLQSNSIIFLYLSFFRRFLHTVKGRAFGSPLASAL
jgi:hypothetical protein